MSFSPLVTFLVECRTSLTRLLFGKTVYKPVMEQLLTNPVAQKEWKSSSEQTEKNSSSGFDCSICLDPVQDPVVTMCGHLYCSPCICKWIHQQSISPETSLDQQPQCPVCKAEVSVRTLIPLYGQGQPVTEPANPGLAIPDRPKGPPCGAHAPVATSATTRASHHRTQQVEGAAYYPSHGEHGYRPGPAMGLAGMFGQMMCTRFMGESGSVYAYPNSYGVANMGSSRARRHVMKLDRSLGRLSFFLLCCLVLCLVSF